MSEDIDEILRIKFGSYLYGTQTPESDTDFKEIYIPSERDIILGQVKKTINLSRTKEEKERNTKSDVDIEIFSLDRYLELLCEGQTVALDMLFSPEFKHAAEVDSTWCLAKIYNNRSRLLSKNTNAFFGYARQQAHKYGVKGTRMDAVRKTIVVLETLPKKVRLGEHWSAVENLVKECSNLISLEKTPLAEVVLIPTPDGKKQIRHLNVCGRKISETTTVDQALACYWKIYNEYGSRATMSHLEGGKDWKALHHALRVASEAQELLRTGFITFPRPDREFLVNVKTGKVPYEKVAEMLEKGLEDILEAQKHSLLRETPDYEYAENIVYEEYMRKVNSHGRNHGFLGPDGIL